MKKFFILLLLASHAFADGIGSGASYMYDSDGNSWFNANSWYMPTDSLGVRYGKTQYYTDSLDDSANRFSLVMNYKSDAVSVNGDLGVSKLGDKTFMIGDTTATKSVNEHVSVFVGTNGDVVDSETGITEQITYRGYDGGIEVFNDKVGAVASLKRTDFSDTNQRSGYAFKTYYVPVDGLSVYLSTKYYESSLKNNTSYFSPDELRRNSLGLSYRYLLGECLLSGYVELGYQDTKDFKETTNAFKVALGSKFSKFWRWQVAYMTDIESTSNYRYNFVTAEIFVNL